MFTRTYNETNGYIPGQVYNAEGGITLAEFQNPNGYALAVPIETGFITSPESVATALVVVNLCGKKVAVVLDRRQERQAAAGNIRPNMPEIDGFPLFHGCSGHFNLPPHCYTVSTKQYVVTERGSKTYLSASGVPLATLANMDIIYSDTDIEGQVVFDVVPASQLTYTRIVNNSSYHLETSIIKSTCAYPLDEEEIAREKETRQPDLGGKIVETVNIPPNGRFFYKVTNPVFVVRILQINSYPDRADRILQEGVPDMNDYVEYCSASARRGQIAVVLQDTSRTAIVVKVYNAGQLKWVRGNIVIVGNQTVTA